MRRPTAASLALAGVLGAMVVMPLALRFVDARLRNNSDPPSFVPSVESPHPRVPFDQLRADRMRDARFDFVLIGDSTAAGRVDPSLLSQRVRRRVAGIFPPGSPVPNWFLQFKNFVVENRATSVRGVLIFFRDDQLTTQVMSNASVLEPLAQPFEPELDRVWSAYRNGSWASATARVRAAYRADQPRAWLGRRLARWPAAMVAREGPDDLLGSINGDLFGLKRLRHFTGADLAVSDQGLLDFDANVDRSLLPEFIRLAQRARVRLGFIRVQRRPTASGPPPQSEALRRYVQRLAAYLDQHDIYFADDYGDPVEPLEAYADGDHLKDGLEPAYTERFARRRASFFQ